MNSQIFFMNDFKTVTILEEMLPNFKCIKLDRKIKITRGHTMAVSEL